MGISIWNANRYYLRLNHAGPIALFTQTIVLLVWLEFTMLIATWWY